MCVCIFDVFDIHNYSPYVYLIYLRHHIQYTPVMACFNITSSTYIALQPCVDLDTHASTYIGFDGRLESSQSQLSKTFFRENPSSIKRSYEPNVCVVLFPSSTSPNT